ncbi:methionyl-tRNA formyltransferase [Chryseobacterium indologenes]|uniref:Bifunctional polymyxin resistance protein ARNA n=1 Tax=Chryseobacterium indologenes TaxID=253 RepID=A0A0N0ZTR5_CHRID|nr:formyltransferase family protein [Chryseobacterium indologenes]KPE49840.1 bifunctional polymyxin resistance protein ARNA [Chryseobacterium indologenes]
MKIIIITQEDAFVVPKNIEKITRLKGVEILKVVDIDSDYSLVNKKAYFIKGFGIFQTIKMGMQVVSAKIINLVDSLTFHKLNIIPKSLKAVSSRYNIDFERIKNPNDAKFLEKIKSLEPDLIVSYSAPVVFKKALLEIPKNGCINLHCSYLPNYAGVMPSFWTLYKKEKYTGATVHYMDSKIDNGKILNQKKVEISNDETMFSLIIKSKEIGGNLMCETIQNIQSSNIEAKENLSANGSYFTWPTVEQLQDFTKNGGRLI